MPTQGVWATGRLIIAAALSMMLCAANWGLAKASSGAAPETTPATYFRLTGAAKVDGEIISFDETIEEHLELDSTAVFGGQRSNNNLVLSRYYIFKKLSNGAGIYITTPAAGKLWRSKKPGENKSRYPDQFLPEIYWVDSLTNPTVREGYLSESYYLEGRGRAHIMRPFKLSYVPPSTEADVLAKAQAATQESVDVIFPPHTKLSDWLGFYYEPIEEAVWKQSSDAVKLFARSC